MTKSKPAQKVKSTFATKSPRKAAAEKPAVSQPSSLSPKTTSSNDRKEEGGKSSKQARVVENAEFTERHNDSSRDEGYWLAAALRARLLRRRGAEETAPETQI
jgi:hypothetical protein